MKLKNKVAIKGMDDEICRVSSRPGDAQMLLKPSDIFGKSFLAPTQGSEFNLDKSLGYYST